jgi:hypothetical protein
LDRPFLRERHGHAADQYDEFPPFHESSPTLIELPVHHSKWPPISESVIADRAHNLAPLVGGLHYQYPRIHVFGTQRRAVGSPISDNAGGFRK